MFKECWKWDFMYTKTVWVKCLNFLSLEFGISIDSASQTESRLSASQTGSLLKKICAMSKFYPTRIDHIENRSKKENGSVASPVCKLSP